MNNDFLTGVNKTLNEGLTIKFEKEQLILMAVYFLLLLVIFSLIFNFIKSAFSK